MLDKSTEKIVKTAKSTGAVISGPIPLPTHRTVYTVLRSLVNKKSREQFQTNVHKRIVDIINSTPKTVESLMKLDLPAGVDIEIGVIVYERLIAKKVGMSQIFDDDGSVVPVTILQAGPCSVAQVKTVDNDGYDAVQIAYGDKKENSNKPLNGHLKKAGLSPKRFLVEFDIVPGYEYKLGQVFNASIFKQGDLLKSLGHQKGEDFRVMKRHGFGGGPKRTVKGSTLDLQVLSVKLPILQEFLKE